MTLRYIARHATAGLDGRVQASGTPCPGSDAIGFHADSLQELAAEAHARAERLALSAHATPVAIAGA